jgi:probable F420-dependent oxidoreductase
VTRFAPLDAPPRVPRTRVRAGLRLPHGLPGERRFPLAELAASAEAAGWDSLWVSDHVVVPDGFASAYPYTADGRLDRRPQADWYDAIVAMSVVAAATERVEVGTSVLVLPLRSPVVVAKQVASLDAIAGGRVALGVGAGWLREEFEALGVGFAARGRRLEEAVQVMRAVWTGRPQPFAGEVYRLPAGLSTHPMPVRPVPVLIGGMTRAALQRVARVGDGWIALQPASGVDPDAIADSVEAIVREAGAAGRQNFRPRVVVRVRGPAAAARRLDELAEAGASEVIVDADWSDLANVRRTLAAVREALEG